tara:strand:+ start:5580 stop:5843 length:264 start_codon:yes stop_codon:yes gene_type:complete
MAGNPLNSWIYIGTTMHKYPHVPLVQRSYKVLEGTTYFSVLLWEEYVKGDGEATVENFRKEFPTEVFSLGSFALDKHRELLEKYCSL